MKLSRWWLVPLMVGLAPLQAAAQNFDAGAGVSVLNPGDVVRVTVWRKPELSGEFLVGPDSTLQSALYRSVRAGGVSVPTAEARVRTVLERFESNPQFVIEPLFRVAVGGEVRKPDLYSFPPTVTVSQAVALAGGPGERGRMDRVRFVREGAETILDLTRPGTESAQIRLRSGDQIIMERDPERRNLLRDVIAPAGTLVVLFLQIVNAIRFG